MKNHYTHLAAAVAARNEVNAQANERFPSIIEALRPFVGARICKVDGTLFKKVNEALPVFESSTGFGSSYWYSTAHGYSLKLNLKTCHGVEPNGCVYAETTLYLGDLSNGVLTRLYDAPNFKADFTEEYVREARAEVEAAEKLKSAAESKIYYFGKYDR